MKFDDKYIDNVIGYYKEAFNLKKQATVIDRQLKLLLLSGETPDINLKKLKWRNFCRKNNYWQVIEKNKGNCIITGSVALYAFGMLYRQPYNLDVIQITSCQIPGIQIDTQYSIDNFNGSLIQTNKNKNLVTKLYHHSSEEIVGHEGFLFHNPYQILRNKLKTFVDGGQLKHYSDISEWLSKMNIFPNQ